MYTQNTHGILPQNIGIGLFWDDLKKNSSGTRYLGFLVIFYF